MPYDVILLYQIFYPILFRIKSKYSNEWSSALRMRLEDRILLNKNKTVAAISEELGYMNPETFIRSFKKFTQMTPTQYRKQIDSYTRN